MSSSTVSKKPTQEAAAPTRSGMVDSREETTKASASVRFLSPLDHNLADYSLIQKSRMYRQA
jgi:hypothetical protein